MKRLSFNNKFGPREQSIKKPANLELANELIDK